MHTRYNIVINLQGIFLAKFSNKTYDRIEMAHVELAAWILS